METLNVPTNVPTIVPTYEQLFEIDRLKQFREKLKVRTSHSNIMDDPFYQRQEQGNTKDTDDVINENIYKVVMEYKEKYELPDELVYIYLHAKDMVNDLYVNKDVYLNLNFAEKMSQQHPSYFDFSLKYAGMGWVKVYSWHNKLKKYVIRYDGGSNGYDVEDNEKKYVDTYEFPAKDQMSGEEYLKMYDLI